MNDTALDQPDPRIGTSVGPYRVESVLGVGGMGTVYCAKGPERELVALKLVRGDLAESVGPRRPKAPLRASAKAEQAGGERAIRLQVGAAFHSELMEPVQSGLAETMQQLEWQDPHPPLVSNASAQVVDSASGVREALVAQIASPVLWVDCVRTMIDAGVTSFLELGPGRVLSGLVRQIEPEAETFAADSPKKLAKFLDRAGA